MPDKVSSIAVARCAIKALCKNGPQLVWPFILMVIVEAFRSYVAAILPMSDPFIWVMYGLPFDLLWVLLVVLVFHVLLRADSEAPKWPVAYARKSARLLGYDILFNVCFHLLPVIIGFATLWIASLFIGGDVSTARYGWMNILDAAVLLLIGAYILVRLSMVFPIVVAGGKEALGRSWRLTKSKFHTLLVSFTPLALVIWGVGGIFDRLSPEETGGALMAWSAGVSVIATIAEMAFSALIATWYLTLISLRQETTESALPGDEIQPSDAPEA